MDQATHPTIHCHTVRDMPGGWLCTVAVSRSSPADTAAPSDHEIRLAWCDHDYWCGGRLAPGVMIEQVVRYLLENHAVDKLPPKFDAAKARRWRPQIDNDLRAAG